MSKVIGRTPHTLKTGRLMTIPEKEFEGISYSHLWNKESSRINKSVLNMGAKISSNSEKESNRKIRIEKLYESN